MASGFGKRGYNQVPTTPDASDQNASSSAPRIGRSPERRTAGKAASSSRSSQQDFTSVLPAREATKEAKGLRSDGKVSKFGNGDDEGRKKEEERRKRDNLRSGHGPPVRNVFQTPLVTGAAIEYEPIPGFPKNDPEKLKIWFEEQAKIDEILHWRRAVAKSMAFPFMLGLPGLCLLIYSSFLLQHDATDCEKPLENWLGWCKVFWLLCILESAVCFADGYRTTRRDSKLLPFGILCLPLGCALCTLLLSLSVWSYIGMRRYIEAANVEEPVYACTGPFVQATWYILVAHVAGLSSICVAVATVIWC